MNHRAEHNNKPVLDVSDLWIDFTTSRGSVKAVNGIDLTLYQNEVLGVVGESGCGKSVMARSIMKLLPSPPAKVNTAKMSYLLGDKMVDLSSLDKDGFRRIRGKEISMIFQEPMTSLNPVYTIGNQLIEPLLEHEKITKAQARERAVELMDLVGIPTPRYRLNEYPHQFSGGMRQRVMIAMAIACNPRILIADEPTTALDVTIQAQILKLLLKIKNRHSASIIFISHDLGVISNLADRVVVMYLGKVVEEGSTDVIFSNPLHPYTQALLASLPQLDSNRRKSLKPIEGSLPDATNLPQGCSFHPRCPHATAKCKLEEPQLETKGQQSRVACWCT
jgi:oligopeptide/dipeptide ABC transporter ATP-binding protein